MRDRRVVPKARLYSRPLCPSYYVETLWVSTTVFQPYCAGRSDGRC